MKNLANCKPSEFLKQTNRIKKVAEKWLKGTGILEIRKTKPDIPDDATDEEKTKIIRDQAMANLSKMLDKALDEYPDETLNLLALMCFVEPENVDDYDISEYFDSIMDMITSKTVLRFFTLLVQLEQMNTSGQ